MYDNDTNILIPKNIKHTCSNLLNCSHALNILLTNRS